MPSERFANIYLYAGPPRWWWLYLLAFRVLHALRLRRLAWFVLITGLSRFSWGVSKYARRRRIGRDWARSIVAGYLNEDR
jgi:hypothetical protein